MSFTPRTAGRPGTAPSRRVKVAVAAAAAATALLAGATGAASAADAPAQTVVVTAARHLMPALDAPAAMTVVTAEEIARSGADDLLDALRGRAGLSLQGRSIGGRRVISLRGMDSKHTLYLVDGRRIGATDGIVGHSDFQYDWIAVDEIERIEVVRGPLSVLYGAEAMGGVVNVITRRAGEHWSGGARVQGLWADGGRGGDGHRAAVHVGGPLAADWTLRTGASSSRRGALAAADEPRLSVLEGQDKTDVWAVVDGRPAAGHKVSLEHREGREQRWADARERSGARRWYRNDHALERRHSALGWEADWSARSASLLQAYRSELDVVNTRSAGVAPNPAQRLTDLVLDGQWRQDVGAWALTTGFEARNESLRDPGLPGGESLARQRALFVQAQTALTDTVDLTAGLRHDRHQRFGEAWSPRVYLLWRAGGGWTVKGGSSHGFKAPNLKQIVPGSRREGPNTVIGNPGLAPETSDAVEFGASWAGRGREIELMLFDQRVRDLIELRLVRPGPVPGIGTYVYENLERARLRGLEAAWAERLGGGWQLQASWTWLDARSGDGEPLLQRPRHALGAQLDWTGGAWEAGLRLDHSSRQWLAAASAGAPPARGPDLTQLGLRLAWKPRKDLTVALAVDNLTDLQPTEKSALYLHAEPPRSAWLTLRSRW